MIAGLRCNYPKDGPGFFAGSRSDGFCRLRRNQAPLSLYTIVLTRKISEDAQDLVWIQGIRPKDDIHVATALDGHVTALETFDENLLGRTGKVGNPPLVIRKPMPPAQKSLFDG